MRKRLCATLAGAVAAISVASAPAASAAVEFGDNCVADATPPAATLMAVSAASSPLPLSAPTGGMITTWRLAMMPSETSAYQTLKVLRPEGTGFRVVAEDTRVVSPGQNSFDVSIPVQAGDRLGLWGGPITSAPSGPRFSLICGSGNEGDSVAFYDGEAELGSSYEFTPVEELSMRVPVAAVIEPNQPTDGGQPGDGGHTGGVSPPPQGPTPAVTLDALARPSKAAITVLVATSAEVPVTVRGSVNLGKGRKATLKTGGRTVPAGRIVPFRLPFTKALKARLKELRPQRKLTLKITASAANADGGVSSDSTSAKLKGQA